jgi:hypothetical protein
MRERTAYRTVTPERFNGLIAFDTADDQPFFSADHRLGIARSRTESPIRSEQR